MVDCRSVYNICAKMCTALKNDGQAFGGVNMIFAGDFAQLPSKGTVRPRDWYGDPLGHCPRRSGGDN